MALLARAFGRKERMLMTAKLTAKRRRTNLILIFCTILVVALKLLIELLPGAAAAGGDSDPLPQEELDRRSQEGVITMMINPEPVFETGEAVGDLLIENAETNSHPIVVEIARADTGERIYASGVIPVGTRVDEGALEVALPAGEYACVATFGYVDESTGKSLGSSELGITVRVLG